MTSATPPPAAGQRLHWEQVPERVRRLIEGRLGAGVVSAATQPGGFSPALAARLRTAVGGSAFVKAVPPDANPDSPGIYRREAEVVSRLPAGLPVPRLLWWVDEGPDGWVVLAFEDVEGRHPAQPWRADELRLVLRAVDTLGQRLTPSPIAAPPASELVCSWQGWEQLAASPQPGLDAWAVAHLDRLVALEAGALAELAGDTLLHLDVRADNVLLAGEAVYVVDWPWASLGPAWVDPLFMAPSVEMQGGPPAWEVFAALAASRDAEAGAVAAVLAALAGMFVQRGGLPPPPGLPTLREFQAAQGRVALGWLRRLLE